jgi:hypothetical protein
MVQVFENVTKSATECYKTKQKLSAIVIGVKKLHG